jgi:peptidoglycan/LPS O-acetylase OafA/YrhL
MADQRLRLHHVDAMRAPKQLGVLVTHSVTFFPPALATVVGTTLIITHVTRFAFMFISAAMLVYAYPVLERRDLGRFWRRRLLAIGLPYVTWTCIYFAMQVDQVASPLQGLERLGYLLGTGYYQLYFLLILLQFCLVYPLFLWLLRRSAGHHLQLVAASVVLQTVLTGLIFFGGEPTWFEGAGGGMLQLWNYQLFLVLGGVFSWHYEEAHRWLQRRWRGVLVTTGVAAAVAEGFYLYTQEHPTSFLAGAAPNSGAFQPATVPLYIGLTACVYLLGSVLGSSKRSRPTRALVQSMADNMYGIYLNQILVFEALAATGWGKAGRVLPWPIVTYGGALIVFVAAVLLSAFLARLPGSRALAGRPRQPWPRLRRSRRPSCLSYSARSPTAALEREPSRPPTRQLA